MLELLSPAGSMEALRAAVQNGANAVYLGIGTFNARQGAKNFTLETLGEALKYCHVRGVDVHLTLNTLVTDREFKAVSDLIRKTAEAGVDAAVYPVHAVLEPEVYALFQLGLYPFPRTAQFLFVHDVLPFQACSFIRVPYFI